VTLPAATGNDPSASRRYVGRFAPSPTGPLHLGSLVAALASWADARAHAGEWLLRIEDVDRMRSTEAATRSILNQLAACGLHSDRTVLRQSARSERYLAVIERLAAEHRIFACACSRQRLATSPRNAWGEHIYPGFCRTLSLPATAHALRFRAVEPLPITVRDRRHGAISQSVEHEVGDFVLRRADGCYSYQLAVVVDDADQGVTDIVRGDDLLWNTPRQVSLQRALAASMPRYLHLPLVLAANGQKLSKQTLAQPIRLDEALSALRAAWRFLGQIDPGATPNVDSFLAFAGRHWQPRRLPPPAPGPARPIDAS